MSKKLGLCWVFLAFVFSTNVYAGRVELTTYYPAPNGEYSSLSATSSFIPPRMTTIQRDAITATSHPPLTQGMVIFNTDHNRLEVYRNSSKGWGSAGIIETVHLSNNSWSTEAGLTQNCYVPGVLSSDREIFTLSEDATITATVWGQVTGMTVDRGISAWLLIDNQVCGRSNSFRKASAPGDRLDVNVACVKMLAAGQHSLYSVLRDETTPKSTLSSVNLDYVISA